MAGRGRPLRDSRLHQALFVTLDHRFHLDSSYRSVLHLLVKLDDWFGEVMGAVEQTARRDRTLVAMVSDHGMNLYPVHVNYGFPSPPGYAVRSLAAIPCCLRKWRIPITP